MNIDELQEKLGDEEKYKGILFALCASLTLCDHMGDVWEATVEALKQAGIGADALNEVEEFSDITDLLPSPVKTLWGTDLRD